MTKLTPTSKLLTLISLITISSSLKINAQENKTNYLTNSDKKHTKEQLSSEANNIKKAEIKLDSKETKEEIKKIEKPELQPAKKFEKENKTVDESKEAFGKFMRIQMPKKDAPDADKVSAYSQKLELISKFTPALEEWTKRVEAATTEVLSADEKSEFNKNRSQITPEAIKAALDDLKGDKPNFTKAEAMRVNVTTCHRMAEKTKETRKADKPS